MDVYNMGLMDHSSKQRLTHHEDSASSCMGLRGVCLCCTAGCERLCDLEPCWPEPAARAL